MFFCKQFEQFLCLPSIWVKFTGKCTNQLIKHESWHKRPAIILPISKLLWFLRHFHWDMNFCVKKNADEWFQTKYFTQYCLLLATKENHSEFMTDSVIFFAKIHWKCWYFVCFDWIKCYFHLYLCCWTIERPL